METHKIDQLFKQKLDRHSETVSADAFAKLQQQMKGKKKKKGFPWMIAASVSILLILSFGIVYNYDQAVNEDIAQIDIKESKINLLSSTELTIPKAQKAAKVSNIKKSSEEISQQKSEPAPLLIQSEQVSRMASIEKVNAFEANIETDWQPELRLSPKKHENKVIVEIHYAYAESKKEENLISKSNNKLKSLASELSLSELRSAKNELFASALQFNKKQDN